MPKVSVIIPTYNRSQLVREAIESVLKQTYSDFEVIVVDDGSTDDTRSAIGGLSDSRIRYFYQDNRGHAGARNTGLLNAKGEYIAYLDSDDLWPEEYLSILINKLEENKEFGVAYTHIVVLGENGRKREVGSAKRFKSGYLVSDFFDSSPCILPSVSCFRLSMCKDVFWDERLSRGFEDHDLFLRVSTKVPFLFVPDTYAIKRHQRDRHAEMTSPQTLINSGLSLERFFFKLGGDKYISARTAKIKISHKFRKAAKHEIQLGHRRAAIKLFKRAIFYHPFDLRLYPDLMLILARSKKNDKMPNWQMPEPLSSEISVTKRRI